MKKIFPLIFLILLVPNVFSILELDLHKGVSKRTPIGLSFITDTGIAGTVLDVISNDLRHSGEFLVNYDTKNIAAKFLSGKMIGLPKDIDYMLVGRISLVDGKIVVKIKFFDIFNPKQILLDKQFTIDNSQLRKLGHHISNLVYEKVTGVKGVFSTKIAYVKRSLLANKSLRYELMVADMDGGNEQLLLRSPEPIMSISWSRDGKRIACVSFERRKAEIYTINLTTGERTLITSFVGLNGAPKFSPDGKKLAIVLSKSGYPDIYVYNLAEHSIRRMTKYQSIDTEPEWSNDGKHIYFTSDRKNKRVQIYKLDVASLDVTRVTFHGNYNSSPQLNRKGDQLIMLHKNDAGFNIAVQNLTTDEFRVLTNTGHITNPSIAPNGKMIIFTSSANNRKVLQILPINGARVVTLKLSGRDIIKPSWGPIV